MRKIYLIFALLLSSTVAINTAYAQKTARDAKNGVRGIVLYNAANSHYYQSFSGSWTWEEAKKKATEHSLNGVEGHLATVTSKEEYDFIVANLWVYDYWIGGYRDTDHLKDPNDFGWRWVTGEPFTYANWNEGAPADKEEVPHVLSFWTGSQKWSPHVPTDKASGYVVEYDTDAPLPRTRPGTPQQEIDKFLAGIINKYGRIETYQATVEFTFKAFVDTLQSVHANLLLQSNGQFRLEGRGENGKLLAISDGNRLMLSTIEPGEKMKYVVKPMPPLPQAIKEAFSLLTSSPKPPSIVELITGTFDRKIFSAKGKVGELIEGDSTEQAIRSHTNIKLEGQDPTEGDLYLVYNLEKNAFTTSDLSFRFKAYPYSIRETHTNIKINEPISGNNFVLVITSNAEQVDDLGEGDDVGVIFSLPR